MDFLIPVKIDHPDRLRNLDIVIKYLNKCGYNNIYLAEHDSAPSLKDRYPTIKEYMFIDKQEDKTFNKMKAFNDLFYLSKSKAIALYDVDAIISKKDLNLAEKLINDNEADVVYPYNGKFYDLPKNRVEEMFEDRLTKVDLSECTLFNSNSRGGVVVFDRQVFKDGGMANENFINVGYDDNEIAERFTILGYRVQLTSGVLIHLNHYRGDTSFNYNKHLKHNERLFLETSSCTKQQLLDKIKSWPWIK